MKDFEIEKGILKRYHGDGGHVIIPEGVTVLGSFTFSRKPVISVTIPKGVTAIEDGVFRDCKTLTEISIPEGVNRIGYSVFQGCEALTGVKLPDSVTEIGYAVFQGCQALTSITLPKELVQIGYRVFSECKNPEIRYHDYVVTYQDTDKTDFRDIFRMLRTKNFSIYISASVKARVLTEMCYSAPNDEEVSAYLKKNFRKIFTTLIEVQNAESVRKLLESGKFITKRNIDSLIKQAIDSQAHEIQLLLMDYKAREIGYEDIGTMINKKFKL